MLRSFHVDTVPDEKKIAEIRAKIAEKPEDPELWFALGGEYFQSDFKASRDAFSRAIALNPFCAEYYFYRGRKHLSTDQYAQALADFHTALRLDPMDGQMWHYLGVALYYLGIYAQAAEYFRKTIAMNAKFGSACIWPEVDWLWMACMRTGDSEGARQALSLVADDEYSSESDLAYKKRVRLYKGVDSIETFMKNVDRVDQLNEVTELYGAVNYYRFIAPDAQKAHALADEILNIRTYLNAFGWKCAYFDRRDGLV